MSYETKVIVEALRIMHNIKDCEDTTDEEIDFVIATLRWLEETVS